MQIVWVRKYLSASRVSVNVDANPFYKFRPKCCPNLTCIVFLLFVWNLVLLNYVTELRVLENHVNGVLTDVNPNVIPSLSDQTLAFYFNSNTTVRTDSYVATWRLITQQSYEIPQILIVAPVVLGNWTIHQEVYCYAFCSVELSANTLANFPTQYWSQYLPDALQQCISPWDEPYAFGQRSFDIGDIGVFFTLDSSNSDIQQTVMDITQALLTSDQIFDPQYGIINWISSESYEEVWNPQLIQTTIYTIWLSSLIFFPVSLLVLYSCIGISKYGGPCVMSLINKINF